MRERREGRSLFNSSAHRKFLLPTNIHKGMLLDGHLMNPNSASRSPKSPVKPQTTCITPCCLNTSPGPHWRCPRLLGQGMETARTQFHLGFSWVCVLILKCALCQTHTGLWGQSPTRLEIPERQRPLPSEGAWLSIFSPFGHFSFE